ncbi:TetR family transcriptional regulator C-terminal domain-containing protein [Streptomyces bobili]|uniref:TetR family transcriptional regulator C-terminal domain-containing protein n=1 Tax=Streptomyces bobili TaxID=67280 RepID=UPI0037010F3B
MSGPEGGVAVAIVPDTVEVVSANDATAEPGGVFYPDPSHPAGCLAISAATNVTPQDAEVQALLRILRTKNVDRFEARLQEAQLAGELPAEASPRALADYFATVLQGLSQRAQDGARRPALAVAARELPCGGHRQHRQPRSGTMTTGTGDRLADRATLISSATPTGKITI